MSWPVPCPIDGLAWQAGVPVGSACVYLSGLRATER
jgi:hypothetical protein